MKNQAGSLLVPPFPRAASAARESFRRNGTELGVDLDQYMTALMKVRLEENEPRLAARAEGERKPGRLDTARTFYRGRPGLGSWSATKV